jgi:hypothetical protein
LPAIILGDFAQLPPIGDTPLYSTRDSTRKTALTAEGQRVYNAFMQSITLSRVFCQEGDNPEQIRFRDALLRLQTYSTNVDDYELFKTRFCIREMYNTYVGQIGSDRLNRLIGYPLLYTLP